MISYLDTLTLGEMHSNELRDIHKSFQKYKHSKSYLEKQHQSFQLIDKEKFTDRTV